jgi:hypothetical protein
VKRILHVQLPKHLVLATVEAPVTEFTIIVVRDMETLAEYEPCSGGHVKAESCATQGTNFFVVWSGDRGRTDEGMPFGVESR